MVYECRVPPFALLRAVSHVAVRRQRMAQVLAVESAVGSQCFGKAYLYGVAACSILYPHLEPSCDILSEVYYRRVAMHGDSLCRHLLHHLHVWTHSSAQRAGGDSGAFGVLPF